MPPSVSPFHYVLLVCRLEAKADLDAVEGAPASGGTSRACGVRGHFGIAGPHV